MASKEVLRMGDARLLRIAEKVIAFDTAELHELLADMRETMHVRNGVGLAAPQIGVNLRVVIFEVADNPRYPEEAAVPQTVLINPVITPLKKSMVEDWEGCLSVPGLRGMVPRYTQIRYQGFNELGEKIDRTVNDFHARVVQHECDHLDGILYPMRIRDMSKLGYTDVLFPGQEIGDD